jgi:hypothetical protein
MSKLWDKVSHYYLTHDGIDTTAFVQYSTEMTGGQYE